MRILSVHSRYRIRGGEDEVCDDERQLLQDQGHVVDFYEDHNDRITQLSAPQVALQTVWSRDTYKALRQRLSAQAYDIVHVHNFLPLISPSVYYAAQASGVPVVQTLHNYRLLCPNALFFRQGQVCEDCLGNPIPWSGVRNACYRNNLAASTAIATMLTVHRTFKTWTDAVNLYIALTEFARDKFIQGGIPAEKILVKSNFVSSDPGVGTGQGGYALYVGRLSVEKGIDVLLAAWEQLQSQVPLKIVGDGPLREEVLAATRKLPNVEWLGRKPIEEVYALMGEAMMLILPSKWYETFGRVAIEAFAKGTPVIAAKIGAIAELVDAGRTGLHFQPADPQDLAAKVEWLITHPQVMKQMRQSARAEFETKYTARKNYHQLLQIYDLARAQSASPSLAMYG